MPTVLATTISKELEGAAAARVVSVQDDLPRNLRLPKPTYLKILNF